MGYHKTFGEVAPTPWVRNAEWLTMPTIVSGDKKFAGLYAIFPDSTNQVALLARGAYTVDWGDGGATENVADNVKAEHTYSYDDADLDGTAVGEVDAVACTFTDTGDRVNVTDHGWLDGVVIEFATVVTTTGVTALKKYYVKNPPITCTFTDAGDVVTAVAHGFANNERVKLYSIVTTTGISKTITYYVVNKTDDTFQLSLSSGGAAVTLTTDGTGSFYAADRFQINSTRSGAAVALTTDGSGTVFAPLYRQVMIQVTMQGAAAFTTINLNQQHSATTTAATRGRMWLDITICGSGLTSIPSFSPAASNAAYTPRLERCTIIDHNITDFTRLFSRCSALQDVSISSMASVTNTTAMFEACQSLRSVPAFDLSGLVTGTSMFTGCFSLQSVPQFNLSSLVTATDMFLSCYSLETIPLFTLGSLVTATRMFSSCTALWSVPALDLSTVVTGSQMFQSCSSLQTLPEFNVPAMTTATAMFQYCYVLRSFPLRNTVSLTNINSIVYDCFDMVDLPLFDTSKATDAATAFRGLYCLQTVPKFDLSKVTTATTMFANGAMMSRLPIIPPAVSFSIASLNLDATALDEIYTNLPTVVGQTITVTGNPGTSGDDPTIATGKGWTVTS